ncbi:MAG: thioredoxin family protein [Albidovulum sp.]|nr:thioredoxin family protein [Albidovulum sp.]MDE0306525.1 thioredoxin family protein [Albidovulum sp.]MDE0531215.1 thioredoxin family protein [Albidovulum sp.]
MSPARPPVCDFGWNAPDFKLPSTKGETVTLADIRGPNGTLIMFICNHCPYVVSALDRIIRDSRELHDLRVGIAAICSNDSINYPDDSFEKMALFADKWKFSFPYLHDECQNVARAYDAVCTPDFFGFNSKLQLQYRGRIDSAGMNPQPNAKRELFEAMRQIAETGSGPVDQTPSMGCSIKWRAAA